MGPLDPKPKETQIHSRSVSLNKLNPEKNDSPEDSRQKKRDYTKRKRDSPPPRDCVMSKRQIFEDKLSKKYQAQRSAKELAREKNKLKKEKAKKDEEETSIASLLKEMREDIREIKSDNKEIKTNMQLMN